LKDKDGTFSQFREVIRFNLQFFLIAVKKFLFHLNKGKSVINETDQQPAEDFNTCTHTYHHQDCLCTYANSESYTIKLNYGAALDGN